MLDAFWLGLGCANAVKLKGIACSNSLSSKNNLIVMTSTAGAARFGFVLYFIFFTVNIYFFFGVCVCLILKSACQVFIYTYLYLLGRPTLQRYYALQRLDSADAHLCATSAEGGGLFHPTGL